MKTHLELFAGIGGIALASEWAGFTHVGFVERDPFCQKVLAKHWPEVPIYDDVTTFDGSEFRGVDLISGGFPCQPHSLAGSRKASGDERDLWGEVVRIVGEAKPRWFLGENVPGLFSSESGRFFGRVVNDLAALGYRVGWACYGASDTGAVHRRNRVFIVGYSDQPRLEGCGATRATANADATDASRISNGQTNTPAGTIGIGRQPRHYVGWGDRGGDEPTDATQLFSNGRGDQPKRGVPESGNGYCSIRGGDWREWGICPTVRLGSRVRGSNDGIPNRVDQLKALGNAVVPQQIYPILKAISEAL